MHESVSQPPHTGCMGFGHGEFRVLPTRRVAAAFPLSSEPAIQALAMGGLGDPLPPPATTAMDYRCAPAATDPPLRYQRRLAGRAVQAAPGLRSPTVNSAVAARR